MIRKKPWVILRLQAENTKERFIFLMLCIVSLSECWYCGKVIEGYAFKISGNECDIKCANQQIQRSKDILAMILAEVDGFVGFGLGFDKPEFFWYIFVENEELLTALKEEFSAAQLGFSIYPLVTEIPRPNDLEMVPSIPEKYVQGGVSVGHLRAGTTGTLGAILRIGERRYAISTATVLAPEGSKLGDLVVHPSRPDSPRRGIILGKLAVISRMTPNTGNEIDAAIVEVRDNIPTTPRIKNLGRPGDVSDPHIGMSVRKSGRTTGFSEGKILCTDVRFKIIQDNKLFYLQDHFIAVSDSASFAEPGDEGSLLMDNTNSLTGMIVMTFHGMAICSKASVIMERFGFYPPECFEPLEQET